MTFIIPSILFLWNNDRIEMSLEGDLNAFDVSLKHVDLTPLNYLISLPTGLGTHPGLLLKLSIAILLQKTVFLGGVLFASATTTSRAAINEIGIDKPKLYLFEAIRPAGGFGLRLLLNRTGRLSIAMDMAFGQNGAKGFYFAVGETF